METDTIAAIATPFGTGGIGIIKISGKTAFEITSAIFRRSVTGPGNCDIPLLPPETHLKSARTLFGHIFNPATRKVVDEVLITLMPGPRSYTREDVVEINTHSGPVVMNVVMAIVIARGARLANPGEFTKRAYLNGRIDLTQAEAVIDIIDAKTGKALEMAANQVRGTLGRDIGEVSRNLAMILTEIEAGIDFPEDVPDMFDANSLCLRLEDFVVSPLRGLLEKYEAGRFIKNGIRILIVGKPNVGKSSLMNCLLKQDRVIVSPEPGTTRDFIEAECRMDLVHTVLVDTAGIHKSLNVVEKMGIQKAYEHIASADLLLFVLDISTGITEEDLEIYENIRKRKHLFVLNKTDLALEESSFTLPEAWSVKAGIKTSALLCQGIGELESAIIDSAVGGALSDAGENNIVINLRHKDALENCVRCIDVAMTGIKNSIFPELLAVDLKEGMSYLDEVLGINVKLDVLDKIFEKFCIGK
jgi:tRNA modification GTPase